MELYESVGDLHGAARAQRMLGFALYQMGRLDEAREVASHALAALSADTWHEAENLNLSRDHRVESRRSSREPRVARAIARANENAWRRVGDCPRTGQYGGVSICGGRRGAKALRLTNEALELASLRKRGAECDNNNAAAYCVALGDLAGAREVSS